MSGAICAQTINLYSAPSFAQLPSIRKLKPPKNKTKHENETWKFEWITRDENRRNKFEKKCKCGNSVHEDRGGEERRSRSKAGRSEVAGLGDSEDVSSTVTLVPEGGGADRTTRRSRPLSLAVQPLNYQRLDPDHNPAPLKHPNMTSQESIGSCSLDIEQSASDRSGWQWRHQHDSICTRPTSLCTVICSPTPLPSLISS